jgi:hypothetical protein
MGEQKKGTEHRHNSAKDGRFVSEEYARKHPATTEKITIHRKK